MLFDHFIRVYQKLIANLTGRFRLPSISGISDFAKDGGLMDYSPHIDLPGQYQQAASYVDRILNGSKPDGLPIQRPDKYRFVINLKTAKALGLTIPPNLLAIAAEVIDETAGVHCRARRRGGVAGRGAGAAGRADAADRRALHV
jgi:putative tryptophan/tyrosine transport system substrate-binding protein